MLIGKHLPLLLRAAGAISADWAAWQSRAAGHGGRAPAAPSTVAHGSG